MQSEELRIIMHRILFWLTLAATSVSCFAQETTAAQFEQDLTLAQRGYVDSQVAVGRDYVQGKGVRRNYASAAGWLIKAATSGSVEASAQLGKLLFAGKGVTQDRSNAIQMEEAAASQGTPPQKPF